MRIIQGYENPLGPGWIQFKPTKYDDIPGLRSELQSRLIRSEFFRPNPSDGALFYEVRVTDLDRPLVAECVADQAKWLVSELKKHHPVS